MYYIVREKICIHLFKVTFVRHIFQCFHLNHSKSHKISHFYSLYVRSYDVKGRNLPALLTGSHADHVFAVLRFYSGVEQPVYPQVTNLRVGPGQNQV